MKTVLATGVFEIIHPGHVTYLTEAKKLGDRLIVIVATDETARKKKRHPVIPEEQRLAVVKALKPVDDAILGSRDDFFQPIIELKPDVIALGPDQEIDETELEQELKARNIKARVVRTSAYWDGPLDATTKIIESVRRNNV